DRGNDGVREATEVPQKKIEEKGKFKNFLSMLKKLSIKIPLIEALEKMPGYAKYMKDLVTKKHTVS
ncbi:MAG: hypothetical protein Q8853_02865, partial [Candidatus Phytoplasma australasiaticum]|nr:hypothetical protein [Candidatus Phytoplasma australasiaticum]